MPNANNVIDFTQKWIDKRNDQMDLFLDRYGEEEGYSEYDETLLYFYDAIQDACVEMGIMNETDEFVKDIAYVMEAVKSMVDRDYGIDHTFHKVIDQKLHVTRNETGDPISVDWKPVLTEKE